MSKPTVPSDALAQGVKGETGIAISGPSHCLPDGEMVLLRASQSRALKVLKRFKMIRSLT